MNLRRLAGHSSYLFIIFLQSTIAALIMDSQMSSLAESEATDLTRSSRQLWADTAFNFIKSINCTSVFFTSHEECYFLNELHRESVNVYIAHPSADAASRSLEYIANVPDGSLKRAGAHYGVVTIDPYPNVNFGHLVVVFFVDKMDADTCESKQGTFMGNDECLTLALKHRCRNALERRWRLYDPSNPSERMLRKMIRKCEINFLPHVYPKTRREPEVIDGISAGYPQHMTCQTDLEGYASCPTLRPANETMHLVCNPIRDNTRHCETSHEAVGTKCRMFESCDQAVIISGGWNRQISLDRHRNNTINMYHLLRRNGFHQHSVKIFYANGMHRGIKEESGQDSSNIEILPAAMKTSMRLHIQKLCRTPHCVDSLVLYLNSPSKPDGAMLLWDMDRNGLVDDNEQYTVDELLQDLESCKARSVQIIADQSFSGEITRAVRRSRNHANVVAFASGKDDEYSYGTDFTDHWVNVDHSHICTHNVFQMTKSLMTRSTPEMGTKTSKGNEGPGPLTLFGAPCNVDPPFTSNELRLYYRGCQNVPTEVWLRTFLASTNSDTQLYAANTRRYRRTIEDNFNKLNT